ncbi:MAG: tetraacyldisaccharide 4'-kinase [Planctomycetia bacterium]|nr:tetraacyldisaccharide 4'-kinase [Planctomycetia bacterium]
MISPEYFHRVVTGRERGWKAFLWRTLFALIQPIYGICVAWRNRKYDRQPGTNVGVPVVSVGNLTLGGTGKTPMVIFLAQYFQSQKKKVAVLSRGYFAKAGELNDEGQEILRRVPGLTLVQNPDRVAGAKKAVEELGAEMLLLDDGFQHRRLFRDCDIVLIHAGEIFGANGKLFPCGTLREPFSQLKRADAVVLTHADLFPVEGREALRKLVFQAAGLAPDTVWAETCHHPVCWEDAAGKTCPLETFAGRRVGIFCGIGNGASFLLTLERLGIPTENALKTFPDHYPYAPEDLRKLSDWAKSEGFSALLCTGKDLAKIAQTTLFGVPLLALRMEMKFLSGFPLLQNLFQTTIIR